MDEWVTLASDRSLCDGSVSQKDTDSVQTQLALTAQFAHLALLAYHYDILWLNGAQSAGKRDTVCKQLMQSLGFPERRRSSVTSLGEIELTRLQRKMFISTSSFHRERREYGFIIMGIGYLGRYYWRVFGTKNRFVDQMLQIVALCFFFF